MRKLLGMARTRIGWAVIGSAATLALGGVATAAVVSSPATDEVSDVAPVTTPATPATAPEAVTEPTVAATTEAPAVIPGVEVPAGTVDSVTEPEAPVEPAAELEAPTATPETAFGVAPTPARMPPLPGEDGYVPPGDASD